MAAEVVSQHPSALASKNGYCFVSFRGTDPLSPIDLFQFVQLGQEDVCIDDECCQARRGFYKSYHSSFRTDLEAAVCECAANSCSDDDDCVVLTGHSQGGGIAHIAALYLRDLNPYVITFGNPPALNPDCTLVNRNATRWFNFCNSWNSGWMRFYDQIFMRPWDRELLRHGYTIILSEDTTGVANLGVDVDGKLRPRGWVSFFRIHLMETLGRIGYADRIHALDNTTYPLRSTGFPNGVSCTIDLECESGSCTKDGFFSRRSCKN